MNPDEIISAAVRNRRNRSDQIDRLRPRVADARANFELYRSVVDDAGSLKAEQVVMQGLRNIPDFFPTPQPVIERMLEHANIESGTRVLEPSAGKGNLCLAARAAGGRVTAVEKVRTLAAMVEALGFETVCGDFLQCSPSTLGRFDLVFMNPPFGRGADRTHIEHALPFLREGGRLVSVASATTCAALEGWADDHGGYVLRLPEGSFATWERSTGVNTGLVVARL